ncbi:MAG TPA: molybdenum ABC transporter ATP-binding protein [Polaromonas sp.]|uniref:molybdenum ABC transporter ATP-binding protein n=1 Tax=Polaromonas sp. TaxID=1869339 RepID=UPI002D2ACE65|nr:molybdenum ABC transporter ATP-binding protein [Polaromonas sp.]HYW56478.1 molybdenum ABC transporter ATP-binding protein [Polaromonas sp.]
MDRITADFKLAYSGFALDVQLDLPGRGVSALFGPSGCGKTTCLRAIAGLEHARGHLRISGDVWQDDAHKHFLPTHQRPLGYVFQEASLFPHLSVRRNVEYGMKRVPASRRRVSLDDAVELLGIAPLMDRQPQTLSGGERQRVAMARALATSPSLLLLDEPLAALDAQRKSEVLPYLERLHNELDIPVIYVSHAMDEVARLADTLVVLSQGRVAVSGPLAQTLARVDAPGLSDQEAGVLLEATILERDTRWHLARVGFAGGSLWLRDTGQGIGSGVRVRVLARDVSVATKEPKGTSIQNVMACVVESISADAHPSQALLRLNLNANASAAQSQTVLLARITARAVDAMGLTSGSAVWAQVKSAALVE